MRRTRFLKAVLRGPEYVCSSCHRTLFKKSVSVVSEKLVEKMRKASEDRLQEFQDKKLKKNDKEFQNKLKKQPKKSPEDDSFAMWKKFKVKSVDNLVYLCSTCKIALSSGKMPSILRDFLNSLDDEEWKNELYKLLQSQSFNQVEVDLFELLCKVLDQNLFAQVDWARNSFYFRELEVS